MIKIKRNNKIVLKKEKHKLYCMYCDTELKDEILFEYLKGNHPNCINCNKYIGAKYHYDELNTIEKKAFMKKNQEDVFIKKVIK